MPNRGEQIDRFRSGEEWQLRSADGERRTFGQKLGDAALAGTGVGNVASIFRGGIDSPGAQGFLAGTGVGNIANLATWGREVFGDENGEPAGPDRHPATGPPQYSPEDVGPPSFDEILGRAGINPEGGAAPDFGDPFADFERAIGEYEQAMGELDSAYEAELERLRGLYEFSETPEEQAMLQRELGHLESQRSAGQQIIESVYGAAIDDAGARADSMRQMAEDAGVRVADLYADTAQRTAAELADIGDEYAAAGLGVGAADTDGVAEGHVEGMAAAAPREGAYQQRVGEIAASDMDWLGSTMAAEQGAQAGDLERLAMQLQHEAQQAHSQRVQDRIAQERMMFAQQSGDLGQRRLDQQAQAAGALPGMWLELGQARHGAAIDEHQAGQQGLSPLEELALEWEMQRAAADAAAGEEIPSDPVGQRMWATERAHEGRLHLVVNLVEQGLLPPDVLDAVDPALLEGVEGVR